MTAYDVAEGLEDALSVARLRRDREILGVPGVGAIRHLGLKKGDSVLIWKDGDAEDSAAAKALTTGADKLFIDSVKVQITKTPEPDAGGKFDVNRILQERGLIALHELAANPTEWALSFAGHILQLSQITDPVAYAKRRKAISEMFKEAEKVEDRVKISVKAIDDEVRKHKRTHASAPPADVPEDDDGAARGRGRAVTVSIIEPWPDPVVDGAMLLEEVSTAIHKYLVIQRHPADAMALYGMHTHRAHRLDVAPKFFITSPQKRSAKTLAMDVFDRFVARPIGTSDITAPALTRVIDRNAPTMLLDEFDALLKGDKERAEVFRGLLNSGFNRSKAWRIISVPLPGGGWEERKYSTFCPQIIAGIGELPDTTADRSIIIEMRRKLRTEKVAPLREKDGDDLRELARKIARWIEDYSAALDGANPAIPPELNDRAADAWAPLLAIADVAGGDWPRRAREAAVWLSGGERTDTEGTLLLSDIRTASMSEEVAQTPNDDRRGPRITSDALTLFLNNLEGHPWAEISRGDKPLTANRLARLLKPFHISPGTIQIGSGKSAYDAKGYYLSQFKDVFERYLSPLSPENGFTTVGTSEGQDSCGFEPIFKPSEGPLSDGLKTHHLASVSAASDVPTVVKPIPGDTREENISKAQYSGQLGPIDGSNDELSQISPVLPEPNGLDTGRDILGEAHVPVSPPLAPSRAIDPNGPAAASKPKQSSFIETKIRETAEQHPDWDATKIGKACGRTASVVRRILGNGQHPAEES